MSLAPSGAASGHPRMPLLTELGGIIHRVAINIALLTEQGSDQSSAASSFTAPEHTGRKRCKHEKSKAEAMTEDPMKDLTDSDKDVSDFKGYQILRLSPFRLRAFQRHKSASESAHFYQPR